MNQQTLPANNTSQQEEPASFMNLQCVVYYDYALKVKDVSYKQEVFI